MANAAAEVRSVDTTVEVIQAFAGIAYFSWCGSPKPQSPRQLTLGSRAELLRSGGIAATL